MTVRCCTKVPASYLVLWLMRGLSNERPWGPKQGDLKGAPHFVCTPSYLLHSGHGGQKQAEQAPQAGATDGKAGVACAANDVTRDTWGGLLPSTCPPAASAWSSGGEARPPCLALYVGL